MSLKSTIYTRTGDSGETSLFGGSRVPKTHQRIVAIGTIDELNAIIGVISSLTKTKKIKTILETIQSDLFSIGAELANTKSEKVTSSQNIEFLEKNIDELDSKLNQLRNFILPGGILVASQSQLARSISRRAEREVLKLHSTAKVNQEILKYLNRLSDFFFVLSRYFNKAAGSKEIIWKKL